MMTEAVTFTAWELMAVELARDLRDGEVGRVGAACQVPLAACLLAQRLHAPSLTVILPNGYVNPKPLALYSSTLDHRYAEGSEAMLDFFDIFIEAEQGSIDFFFYSGLQIDKHGNVNSTRIGSSSGHLTRGPGLPQVSFASTLPKVYLFSMKHERRCFVDRVDYVSAPGFDHFTKSRTRRYPAAGGPRLCVTPLATFTFHDGLMTLRSTTPGVTVAAIQERTAFPVTRREPVSDAQPPSTAELDALRSIDTTGLLREGQPLISARL